MKGREWCHSPRWGLQEEGRSGGAEWRGEEEAGLHKLRLRGTWVPDALGQGRAVIL